MMTEAGKEYFRKSSLLRFAPANPGFDSLIISPSVKKTGRAHFTFIETRYSAEESSTSEPFSAYQAKYDFVAKLATSIQVVMEREIGETFDWHFVYALYRKTSIDRSRLLKNTIFMGREKLNEFYGPSLACLGML